MADESIIANLQSKGFDELIKNLDASAKGFTLLDNTITEAQKKLSTLDKNSQDFKELTKEINAAKTATEAYSLSTDTLKKDLRTTTDEIGKLERALQELEKSGQKNTQTYKEIAIEQGKLKTKAGELKDTIGDLNAEIKNSGSDTKNLDKALRAINTVASGYQAAQGALVLFGGENKKFEQTLLKLNAVMALTQGLQQIQQELSQKDSIFTAIATRAKIAYAAATASSSIALNAFRLALIATGIGAFVVLVGALVANWDKLKTAIFGATISLDDFNKKNDERLKKQQEANDLLETELKYKVASGQLTKEEAEQRQRINNAGRLQKETDELEKQLKIKEDLQKKQFEIDRTTGVITPREAKRRADAIAEQQKIIALQKSLVEKTYDELITYEKSLIEKKKDKLGKAENDAKIKDLKSFFEESNKISADASLDEKARLQKNLQDYLKYLEDKKNALIKALSEENELSAKKAIEQVKDNGLNLKKRIKADNDAKDEINTNSQNIIDETKRAEQEKRDNAIAYARATGDAVFTISKGVSDARMALLENEFASGMISEEKYIKEKRKLKRQEAIANKAEAIFNISLSIAEAIMKAYATAPGIGQVLAGLAAGIGFAQLAFVIGTPLPEFAKGVIDLQDSKAKDGVDTVPALLSKGESVMTVEETREHKAVLQAIRNKTFNKLFVPANMVKQADIFANIPNPANMEISKSLSDDYSSINERLDETNNKLWWLTNAIKEGNKQRVYGNQKIITNLKPRYVG